MKSETAADRADRDFGKANFKLGELQVMPYSNCDPVTRLKMIRSVLEGMPSQGLNCIQINISVDLNK